jgi:RNA polymerase sigma factor (sigma-70 family)
VPEHRRATRRSTLGLLPISGPLERDDEIRLHEVIADGRHAATELALPITRTTVAITALRRRVRAGRLAEEQLLAGTAALVRKRVTDLGFPYDQDDLESAGIEGLVRALRAFEPTRGVRFATYANYWISKLVYSSISHHVHYPDADLRLLIRFRRYQRHHDDRPIGVGDVMRALGINREEAARVMNMSSAIAAGYVDVHRDTDASASREDTTPWPEAQWIIDRLKSILGEDFEDFWMWTGRVMSLEELGERHGISKQAMSKRVVRWRRLVESSADAKEMLAWLRAQ